MERLNIQIAKINRHALTGLLLIIPCGLCYRIIEMFSLEKNGINSEWASLVLIFLFIMEVYLSIIFIWLDLLSNKKMN